MYGVRLLEALRGLGVETHLVMTEAAERVAALESSTSAADIRTLADFSYKNTDLGASIASGSFLSMGMAVAPCSIKSLSGIVRCSSHSLLTRTADVMLKERRRLVLVVRETPLHLGHLRLMTEATEYGAVVLPPIPGFYQRPRTVDEIVDHIVGKILDQFGLEHDLFRRWQGEQDPR